MAGFIGAGTAFGAAGMADTANVFAQDAQNTEYTVTFKNNGQGNVPDALKVAGGKTIARAVNYDAKKLRPAVTVIDGYKFDDSGTSWGLYTDEACTKAFDVFNTPITQNTTLYVKWVPVQTHKITFKANGVTADPPAIVVEGGVASDLELPFEYGLYGTVVGGKSFAGWYTDPSLDNEYEFDSYGSNVDSDIILYAKWERVCTIHYDTNGIGKAPEDEYTWGVISPSDLNKPQGVKGKAFAGWYKEKECKNPIDDYEEIAGDITVYAKWVNATTHTVKLETDGFGNLPKEIYIADGYRLSSFGLDYYGELDREGYVFTGWFTSKTGGKEIEWYDYVVTDDTTIYARWSSLSDKVAITFDTNGHGEAPDTMEVTPGYYFKTYYVEDVKGYQFLGWSEQKNSNNTLYNGKRIYENTTFYAVWEPVDNYKVSFDMNGHENATNKPGDFYEEYSFDFSVIDTPVDAGYAFVGWYFDKKCTNKAPDYVDLDSDITFYAKWLKEGDATLSFDSNGHGTAPASIKGKIGDSIGELGLYKHYNELWGTIDNGYAFRGWYLDKDCTTEAKYYDILEKNTTLYAKWESVGTTHTISFDANGHGTAPKSIKIEAGTPLYDAQGIFPNLGEADGYVHLGWAMRPDARAWEIFDEEEITKDVTVYAVWYKGIDSVDIMLADPVVGKEISTPIVTVPSNAHYRYGASWDLWDDDPMGNGLNNFWSSAYREEMDEFGQETKGLFKCGEEYIATIWISSDASRRYVFSENPDIKVNGKKPDKIFSVEDNRILIGVIQKTDHDWGDWTVTKQPTATEDGVKTRVCKNDPEHIETQAIPDGDDRTGVYKENDQWIYLENGEHITSYTGYGKSSEGKWVFVRNGVFDPTYTGLAKNKTNGGWFYAEKGVYKTGYTGIAKSTDDKLYYVKDSKWDQTYTGLAKYTDGKWYYVNKGTHVPTYTGFAKSTDGKWYYVNKGVWDKTYTGFAKSVDGKWCFARNGKYDNTYTGLAKNASNGGWFYAEKGIYKTGYTGIAKSTDNKLYYVKDSAWDKTYTGLAKYTDGKWYYVKNGAHVPTYTGISVSTDGNLYFVKDGVWDKTYTGLGKYTDGKWYYVKNGAHVPTYTGLTVSTDGKYYYAENGVWDKTYTGYAKNTDGKWYFVRNGAHDSNYTGLAKNKSNGGWFYAENGVYKTGYTGIAKSTDNNLYYVKDSKWDQSYTGLAKYTDGKWYYVNKGTHVPAYTGVCYSTDGKQYYAKDGKWDTTFTGKAKDAAGKEYNVTNGRVVQTIL